MYLIMINIIKITFRLKKSNNIIVLINSNLIIKYNKIALKPQVKFLNI